MSVVLRAIDRYCKKSPAAIALECDQTRISYSALNQAIQVCALRLQLLGVKRLGLLMDNNPAWAIIDLAALAKQVVLIPLPEFFSDEQLSHAIESAGIDGVLTDQPARLTALLPESQLRPSPRIAGHNIWYVTIPQSKQVSLPKGTSKVTFTSGTTGRPKGVCLSDNTINAVVQSLAKVIETKTDDKHMALLPLAVLLENIAGLYVALLRGVPCNLPSLSKLGGNGASGLDPVKIFSHVTRDKATSIIMIPQMLQAMIAVEEQGVSFPALRFAAVGGASVSPQLLQKAQQRGLPIYEGYGLSECASVVTVNTPSAMRLGSVGKVLPHIKVKFSTDGEVLIHGSQYLGYLGEELTEKKSWLASGDIGHVDEDGYLYITGRKKNIYITSFGRNVSPEWVERELLIQPAIAQAVVFGESLPWSTAVVVPRPGVHAKDIDVCIQNVNGGLPDYAGIGSWIVADETFTPDNRQYTANGRPRRDVIWQHYKDRVNQFYSSHMAIA